MSWGHNGSSSLKFHKRLKVYKNSTNTCSFNPETLEGRSYRWTFCAPINGVVVFNTYNWSVTTSSHQSAVASVLRERGINYISGDFGDADVKYIGRSASREMFKAIVELEIKIECSRKPEAWSHKFRVERLAEMKTDLEKLEQLDKRRFKLSEKEKKSLRAEVEQAELDRVSELEAEKCFKFLELKRASENLTEINF